MRVLRLYVFHADTLQRLRSVRAALFGVLILLMVAAPSAYAAVSLLLEQPYGKLNLIDPAGHAAIYLDHVCAETPLKLRACRPGEAGVVLSRYDDIGDHDWIAMPLIPYLYSVSAPAEIPQRIDRAGELELREAYRERYLQAVAADRADGGAPGGNWYELLGSAFDRTIYGFRVNTTAEQDEQLIANFNDRKNVEKYNGALRNCADFARVTLNRFYPHAVHRNYIADLGLTSPKSVARSLGHYAARHPETGFEVFMIPQVKGDLPRSHANTDLAEGILKRYGLPLVVLSPVSTAVAFAAYVGQGRFSMPKHPALLNVKELEVSDEIARPFSPMMPALPPPTVALVRPAAGVQRVTVARNTANPVAAARVGVAQ